MEKPTGHVHLLKVTCSDVQNGTLDWQLYYATAKEGWSESQRIDFTLCREAQGFAAILVLSEEVDLGKLRIDFGEKAGRYVISSLELRELPLLSEVLEADAKRVADHKIYHRFHEVSDDAWLKVLCWSYDHRKTVLPDFPEESIQFGMVGSSGVSSLKEIYGFYREIRKTVSFNANTRVLDFGCGYGRLTRFFLKDTTKIFGVDTCEDFIKICRDGFDMTPCQFIHNTPFPPLDIEDSSVDVITAYSVFTHLSEEAVNSWLDEFHRILKPGGVFIFTLRQKNFLEIFKQDVSASSPYVQGLAKFFGGDEMLKKYDAGEYMYLPSGGGRELTNDFYGDAVIPERYVRKIFAKKFEIQEMFDDNRRIPLLAFCALKAVK